MNGKLIFFMGIMFSVAAMILVPSEARPQDEWGSDEYLYELSIEEYLTEALPDQDGRTITYNDITGILTVTDTPTNHKLIEKLIKQFDIGPQQVMIEAKFVEITFEDLDELGIEWYWHRHGDITFTDIAAGEDITNSLLGSTDDMDSDTYYSSPNYQGVQWDVESSNQFPVTDFGLGFIISQYESGKFLTAYLKALASEERANLLSSPKITTLSGQNANIQVTQKFPYVSEVDFENQGTAEDPIWVFDYTIEEKVTGITLEVTPYVNSGSNIITLDLHPEVSNLIARRPIYVGDDDNPFTQEADVPALLGWPVIDTRTSRASVMVKSGETIVMGGFVKDDETLTKKKVPLLGDIPFVGNLFKYEYKSREKKNLVIFLTATIITPSGSEITSRAKKE
ncbi:MAG: hypothetical protein JW800_00060 [Candidatus Omnitrophica bacterium]|nr:hypothetical protein [Candidatus Omnitrophota bacterium]